MVQLIAYDLIIFLVFRLESATSPTNVTCKRADHPVRVLKQPGKKVLAVVHDYASFNARLVTKYQAKRESKTLSLIFPPYSLGHVGVEYDFTIKIVLTGLMCKIIALKRDSNGNDSVAKLTELDRMSLLRLRLLFTNKCVPRVKSSVFIDRRREPSINFCLTTMDVKRPIIRLLPSGLSIIVCFDV